MKTKITKTGKGGYNVEVIAKQENIKRVYNSMVNYISQYGDGNDSDFFVSEYVMEMDKFDLIEYIGSFTNNFEDPDTLYEILGRVVSFQMDNNKLFIEIRNAEWDYNEDDIKRFFFYDAIESDEDKQKRIEELEAAIEEKTKELVDLNEQLKSIQNM